MEHFHLYGLMFMVLGAKSELNAVVVSIDEEAVLPCVAPEPYLAQSCLRVRWIKNVKGAEQEILFSPERVGNLKRVKNPDAARAKLKPGGNESHSLLLTKVIKSDEGLYSCEIWRGWDRITVQNSSLKIKDCKTSLVVLPAGLSSVNITCPLEKTMQMGPTDVSWMMLKATKAVSIPPGMAEINGSLLILQSTNGTDDSWYRCTYTLGDVQRCYDFKLKVQAEGPNLPSTPETRSGEEQGVKAEEKKDEENEEGHPPPEEEAAGSSRVLPVAVTVVLLAAMAASMTGFFLYRRSSRQSAAPRSQWITQGPSTDSYANCRTRGSMVFNTNSIYHEIDSGPIF